MYVLVKKFVASLVLFGVLVFPVATTATVTAMPAPMVGNSVSDACTGIGLTGTACGPSDKGKSGTAVSNTIKTIVNVLSAIVGVAAVFMIILSGFKYVTASGDASKITSAKNTLIYAIVGLVVVGLAQLIVQFVITSVKP